MDGDAFERFLEEALAREALTPQEAADCRRIGSTLSEVGVAMSAGDVARRKGYLDSATVGEILRALAKKRIGKYEVLERLGAGSAGVVWRARDTKLGRIVALKVLARHRDGLSKYHERFLREARIAVTLNDVHIVRGLDYGEADGYCFFAMEFVAGESASQRLEREGRIEEKEALRIARDVVRALVHVQRFDLVHRDIKPSNLLITPSGQAKVCDFGLAKPSIEEAARMGGDGTTAGTPRYMSPEQIRDPTRIDWRSDCYSLGATLFHMLTGTPPFGTGDGGSIIHKHLTQPPRDPREFVPDLSQGAAAVVLKMLQKDPAERYASLSDLADDLESVIAGRPPVHTVTFAPKDRPLIEARTDRQPIRPGARRRRKVVFTAAVVLAGTLAWVGWQAADTRPAESSAPSAPPSAPGVPGVSDPPPPLPVVPGSRPDTDGREIPAPDVAPDPGLPALEQAERRELAGADVVELIRSFEWIATKYAGEPSGERAAARSKQLRVRLGAEAVAALTRRRHEARPLEKRGRYGAAIALLDEFPSRFADTPAAKEARREADRLREEGRAYVENLLAHARLEIAERSFGDAQQHVGEAEAADVPGTRTAVAEVRAALDDAATQHEARRRAEEPVYRALYGEALRTAHRSGAAVARSEIDEVVSTGAVGTYGSEVDELRRHIDSFERVEQALFREWDRLAAAAERPVAEVGSGLNGVPVAVVDRRLEVELKGGSRLEVLVADMERALVWTFVEQALEAEDLADQEALFLYLLGSGNFVGARQQIEVLGELAGADPQRADLVKASAGAAWWRVWDAAVSEADALIRSASLARRQGRTVDARRELDRALRSVPSYAPLHIELGLLHMDLGALEDAEGAFRTALGLDGAPRETRYRLAQVLVRRDRLPEAEQHVRAFLGDSERPAELEDAARGLLEHVVAKRKEGRLRLLWREARKELRARRHAPAEQLLTQILDIEPTEADALFEVGRIYAASGRLFAAYRAFTLFLREHPEDGRVREAVKARAEIDRFKTPKREARELLQRGRAAQPEDRLDDAIELFRRALEVSPFLTEARFRLGEALLERASRNGSRDDLVAGEAELADVVLLHPEHWSAMRELARARLALGRAEQALVAARRAMDANSEDAVAAVLAGRAHFALRQLDAALERFEEASRRDPRAGEPVMRRAIVHERQGRRAQARHLVERIYAEDLGVSEAIREELRELHQRLQD